MPTDVRSDKSEASSMFERLTSADITQNLVMIFTEKKREDFINVNLKKKWAKGCNGFALVLLQCCGFMMCLKGIPSTYNKDLQVQTVFLLT